jgi:hypothetical protein
MAKTRERSTVGVEITMKDSNGVNIDPAAISAFLIEAHAEKPGAANPIDSSAAVPTANPYVYVLDLTGHDLDAIGHRVFVEWKLTYTDAVLGAGTVVRSDPFEISLLNSRIST